MKKTKAVILNRKRTMSRLMAIQVLYQYNFYSGEKNIEEIKNDVIDNYTLDPDWEIISYRDKIDENFLNNLVAGIILNKTIKEEVNEFLKDDFNLENIDEVIEQILQLSALEFKLTPDTPLKVIIDEYIDIASGFFNKKRVTFINAALESLSRKYRPIEFKEIKQS